MLPSDPARANTELCRNNYTENGNKDKCDQMPIWPMLCNSTCIPFPQARPALGLILSTLLHEQEMQRGVGQYHKDRRKNSQVGDVHPLGRVIEAERA